VVNAFIQNNVWDVNAGATDANGTFIFSTASFTNTIESAMIGSVSYTNDSILDPRPQVGSPLLTNVKPGAPVAVSYRGAFAPNDDWANGWSTLARAGFMDTTVVVTPNQPVIATDLNVGGGNIGFVFGTQTGFNYQIQSTTNLATAPIVWADEGGAIAGDGSTVTNLVPVNDDPAKFFRVKVQ
jgi:hypothetical protein